MEATKNELLLAWMTLVKLRDSNVLDAGDDQIILSALQILDEEQSHTRNLGYIPRSLIRSGVSSIQPLAL
jgi:hypothetical protein